MKSEEILDHCGKCHSTWARPDLTAEEWRSLCAWRNQRPEGWFVWFDRHKPEIAGWIAKTVGSHTAKNGGCCRCRQPITGEGPIICGACGALSYNYIWKAGTSSVPPPVEWATSENREVVQEAHRIAVLTIQPQDGALETLRFPSPADIDMWLGQTQHRWTGQLELMGHDERCSLILLLDNGKASLGIVMQNASAHFLQTSHSKSSTQVPIAWTTVPESAVVKDPILIANCIRHFVAHGCPLPGVPWLEVQTRD